MPTVGRWWEHPLTMGVASLAIALTVTFLPLGVNVLRARTQAPVVEIIASPGTIVDSLGSRPCAPGTGDTAATCKPAATK
jgi:hypothetical protein